MKRVIQSILGGITIMAGLIVFAGLFAEMFEQALPVQVLMSPVLVFSLVFPPEPADMFFSKWAFWAALVFELTVWLLVAYLVIELLTAGSAMRSAIRDRVAGSGR